MEVVLSLKSFIFPSINLFYTHSNKGEGMKVYSYAAYTTRVSYYENSQLSSMEYLIKLILL
jgi:hypothetical protein